MYASDYGARVTLVDAVTGNAIPEYKSIDFSSVKTINGISLDKAYHYGGLCKSDYINGAPLLGYSGGYEYVYAQDIQALDDSGNPIKFHYTNTSYKFFGTGKDCYFPCILTYDDNSITFADEIKSYFTNACVLQFLADKWNISKSTMMNGNYKLMVEPLAYFSFPDYNMIYAATVTETWL